ncbi:HIT-like protein [compost metagenome]
MDCLFCKIINKEIPAEVIYEDEYVFAFKDIHPVAPVHVLVIPKLHITSANDITTENSNYIAKIYEVIPEIAKKLGIFEDGYRIICNIGEDGGQVIKHIHFHIIGGKHLGPKIIRD